MIGGECSSMKLYCMDKNTEVFICNNECIITNNQHTIRYPLSNALLHKFVMHIRFGITEKNLIEIGFTLEEIKIYAQYLEKFIIVDDNEKFVLILDESTRAESLINSIKEPKIGVYIQKHVFDENEWILNQYLHIVVCVESYLNEFFSKINGMCQALKKHILNILISQNQIIIGPSFKNQPNQDYFCYNCLKHRIILNEIDYIKRDAISSKLTAIKQKIPNITTAHFKEIGLYIQMNEVIERVENKNVMVDITDVINKKDIYIYPIPYCKTCSSQLRHKNNVIKSRAATSNIQLNFVNSKYGIFRRIMKAKTELKDSSIYYYTIQIPSIFSAINNIEMEKFQYNIAGGVSIDKNKALSKAIGEAAERYCLEAYDVKNLKQSSKMQLLSEGNKVVSNLQLFDDWQYEEAAFPFKKITDNMQIYWVKCWDVLNEENIYVPASFIYSRFKKIIEDNSIGYLTTSGAATGVTVKEAILYGIYELIERDCTMITWLQQLRVPEINLDNETIANSSIQSMLNILRKNNIIVRVYYITLELEIPCFLAIGESKNSDFPAMLIGAGCRWNKEEALNRALEEIIQGCSWKNLNEDFKAFYEGKNYENVVDFRHRVVLYAKEYMKSEFDFLSKSEKVSWDSIISKNISIDEQYNNCIEILKKNNMNLIFKELTTIDIMEIGLNVVKVFIPELQQIDSNHNYRFLNCVRTKDIPKKLGYEKCVHDSKKYNLAPHPFP